MAELERRMQATIIGQDDVIRRMIVALLANGHLLLESLPGLAKTRAVKALARNLDASMRRIQFTPDLLPSDITGSEILHRDGVRDVFQFQEGPIFGNVVLGDEINRAPAKVQSALLEAMEERQVTVAGTTHPLPELFLVVATQNPIEQEGTYPLPEAQMDRFLMKVVIGYPDEAAETQVIQLVRDEEVAPAAQASPPPAPIAQRAIFDARAAVHAVAVAPTIERYIVDLVFATRFPERYGDDLRHLIQVGASPRGGLALDRCARAHAWLEGRDHVSPDDVRAVVHECLRHRLILSYEANADGVGADEVVKRLVEKVAVA
jgi:MoxR-like ATPase